MITYTALSKNPAVFRRLSGHTLREFDLILDKFKSVYGEDIRRRSNNPKRKRAWGAGKPSHIKSIEDKLLFILVYMRIYPLLFLQGIIFNLSESNACYWAHTLLPMLDKALGYTHKKPERGNGKTLDEILEEFPELKSIGVFVDGMERPIRKPKNKGKNDSFYSGKAKRHTVKNIVIANPDSYIHYLGKTQPGRKSDKTIFDEDKIRGPDSILNKEKIPLGADLGFEGVKIRNVNVVLPNKKPCGRDLTEAQRDQNEALARARIRVENAICGVKRSRSVSDTYRGIKEGFEDILINVACGLHNTRVAYRYSTIIKY